MCEQTDTLGTEWETHRPAVFGVAYRLLGSVSDAEDVAQDVWLRAAGADLRGVDDLRAWLVTVAARRSYDIPKSARMRRTRGLPPGRHRRPSRAVEDHRASDPEHPGQRWLVGPGRGHGTYYLGVPLIGFGITASDRHGLLDLAQPHLP